MRKSTDLPSQGLPNSVSEKLDDAGQVIQKRFYDANGRALKNIDFGHNHTGVGDPHAHDWDWNKSQPRQAARAIQPGEPQ